VSRGGAGGMVDGDVAPAEEEKHVEVLARREALRPWGRGDGEGAGEGVARRW